MSNEHYDRGVAVILFQVLAKLFLRGFPGRFWVYFEIRKSAGYTIDTFHT